MDEHPWHPAGPLDSLRALFDAVREGRLDPSDAERRAKDLTKVGDAPFEDLGFARIDHDRAHRQGFPEVVFGQGKTSEQVALIAKAIVGRGHSLLVTRTDAATHAEVAKLVPDVRFHEQARIIERRVPVAAGHGVILVVAAGTSDIPVAEEASVSAEVMGNVVDRLYDVGVAGLHRLLAERERLRAARVVIAVAGMEGALPSVVGGLVRAPVIAVPTSVGYGASFGGMTALLAMLNSCATGVSVVNIDNGFGAAAVASSINHLEQG
ncbi:MAG TPA: nickel pincer cofactor biosynthesis protein LarB [Vicinamibacterales bacterium]|nr:nickel pincer cofactor biosynthesis protein LarB [Vicinamibacterales bacterium]